MQLDPEKATPTEVYSTMIRAITPRPIAWVSTISEQGISNLAPFSFFNGICSKPAALMFSPVNRPDGTKKDTVVNIEANGEFVVNVVPYSLAKPMFQSASDFQYEESEFDATGLTSVKSQRVRPPSVGESPIQFECELIQIVNVGEGPLAANVIIGRILLIEIDESILNERGKIDPTKVDAIGRMGGLGYCRTQDRFDLTPNSNS